MVVATAAAVKQNDLDGTLAGRIQGGSTAWLISMGNG
jgi:hypothetical protein